MMMNQANLFLAALVVIACFAQRTVAFVAPTSKVVVQRISPLHAKQDTAAEGETLEAFLKEKYPLVTVLKMTLLKEHCIVLMLRH